MLCSLLLDLVPRSRRSGEQLRRFISLGVEELEERCVLSADTIAAVPSSPFPFTVPGDLIVASQPKGDPGIVFLGDSITWGFANGLGAPVWSAVMAPAGAADYGVAGQTTQTLLFQLSLGQLQGINPTVVVLTIGTNNLLEGDTPQDTALGILADVQAIHEYLPGAQVLVLGVSPGGANPTDPYRLQADQTDALVSQMLASDPKATFVNIAPALEQPDGTISNAVLIDFIHPTALGYFDLLNALTAPLEQATAVNIAPALEGLHDAISHDALPLLVPLSLPKFMPSVSPPPSENPSHSETIAPSDGKVANWLLSAGNHRTPIPVDPTAAPNVPASKAAIAPAFAQPNGKTANEGSSDSRSTIGNHSGSSPTVESALEQQSAPSSPMSAAV